jgi:hypothetical protein
MAMPIRNCAFLSFVASAALGGAAQAATADFVFGDDFDSSFVCPASPIPTITATMTPASRTTLLGTRNSYLVKVLSCGYAGNVTFSAGGAPGSWTLSMDPPSVQLAAGAVAVAELIAAIPTDGASGLATLKVDAQAVSNTVPLSATLDAADEVLVTIPDGTGSGDHHLPPSLHLRVGTLLRMYSADSLTGHIIHADGVPGFLHQNTSGPGLQQGESYDLISIADGSGNVYCHSHGMATGNIVVTVSL